MMRTSTLFAFANRIHSRTGRFLSEFSLLKVNYMNLCSAAVSSNKKHRCLLWFKSLAIIQTIKIAVGACGPFAAASIKVTNLIRFAGLSGHFAASGASKKLACQIYYANCWSAFLWCYAIMGHIQSGQLFVANY